MYFSFPTSRPMMIWPSFAAGQPPADPVQRTAGPTPTTASQAAGTVCNNRPMAPERRHSLRQKVNTPAFASFDGVTGGMILDLSEEGMAMKSLAALVAHSILP